MALHNVQEHLENSGWRIKKIPWGEKNKAQFVFNTPLSLVLALVGVLLFVGPIVLVLQEKGPKWSIAFSVVGLAVLMLSRVVASRACYRDWIEVEATCVDRETRKRMKTKRVRSKPAHAWRSVWEFRLVCRFEYQQRTYEVTPECHGKFWDFSREDSLTQYLEQAISEDGRCRLFIDPKNPMHAVFHEVPLIA